MNDVVAAGFGGGGAGRYFLALRSDNTMWTWGENEVGQIGDGTTADRHEPTMILDNVVSASALAPSFSGGKALREDGSLWAWGQLRDGWGDDATVIFESNAPVMIMQNFYAEHGPAVHSPFIADDGTEWPRYSPMRQMEAVGATMDIVEGDDGYAEYAEATPPPSDGNLNPGEDGQVGYLGTYMEQQGEGNGISPALIVAGIVLVSGLAATLIIRFVRK
jgi:hypothetical protein